MTGKKIVVVGGGFGGVAAARVARSLLDREHEVVLLDRSRRTYLCASFPLMLAGEGTAGSRSLGVLANRGIRYVEDEVEDIDLAANTVTSSSGKMDYDYLVVALGVEYDWDAVTGAREAYSFYDVRSARKLRRRLSSFRKGRIVIAVSTLPYKCPPAPYEAAMILDWAFGNRGVRGDIEIHVFTPEPTPLAIAGPEASARLVASMERKGIHVHTGAGVTEVSPDGREASFSDGASMDADLVITIPTHRVPRLMNEVGLAGASGWVEVAPRTLQTRHPSVYAVGDVNAAPMANGMPLPKAGVFASSEGETVGRNIAAAIMREETTQFPGVGQCFIAYGGGHAGMVRGDFLAAGKPDVQLSPATARGFRAKERFESDWKRFRI